MFLKRFFKYIEPAWSGNDGKISLRASLAIAFSIDFIRNVNYAIFKWDSGRSLEGLSLTLGIEAGLIVGLLGLTTYQHLQTFGKTTGGGGDGYYNREYTETTKTSEIKTENKDDVQRVEGEPSKEVL